MARVPQYTPSVAERPALQSRITVQASGEDFGAGIGRGLQQVGQGLQQASNVAAQLQDLQAQADAKDRINQLAEWQMNAAYGENGFMSLQGRAAMDGYGKYVAELKRQRSEFSAKLGPAAKAIYDQASESRILAATQSALVHRSDQTKVYMVGTSTARQEMLANEAMVHAGNPTKVNASLALGSAEVREQASLLGWDEHTTNLKVQEYQSTTLKGVVLQIAQGDPIAAVEFLKEYGAKMTPIDALNLIDKLGPAVAGAAARDAVEIGSAPAIAPGTAADLIMGFENFSSGAYPDVGGPDGTDFSGWRVGYGSDTVTRADGSVVAVDPSTVVTREDARRDLDRRIAQEFLPRAVNAVGAENWLQLDGATQRALLSITYNYGSLPNSVARAAMSGDRMAIAAAIEGLAGHNGGINADRRRAEAALVRQGLGAGVQFSARVENVLQSLPAEMAVQIREVAADEIGKERAAQSAARRAASATAKDSLALGIATGTVQSDQEILGHPDLDDGDKASLINTFHTAQNATAEARSYLNALTEGTARGLNPFYSDDRSLANKAFEMAMADLPVDQRKAAGLEFVRDSGIVPDQMIAAVRNGLNSTDFRSVGAAMEQSAVLMIAAPIAVGHLENASEIEQAAAQYTALVDGQGMSRDEAAARVIELRDPKNQANAELLKASWAQVIKDNRLTINDVLVDHGDNFWPGGPQAGITPLQQEAVLSDYLSAAEAAFKGAAQGDLGIAKSMALARMRRTYGISRVSGSEIIMPFPPENFYPAVGGSHDYIRQMALADVREIAPDAQNVMLTAVPETAQDVRSGRPPRYSLSYVGPDGVIDTVPGLFVVDTDQLQQLASLDSEERRIRFEIERQYKDVLRSRPNDLARTYLERVTAGLAGPPPAADVVPGYSEYQDQLLDIDLRRGALLGHGISHQGTTVMTREQIDPRGAAMAAEQQWNERQAATFGMMGGTQ